MTRDRPPGSDPIELSDELLIERVRSGEDEAFGILFDRHAGALSGKIRRGLPAPINRKVSVADILQEVRIAAFKRMPDFEPRGEGSFRKWLMRFVEHKLGAALKKYGRAAKRAARVEVTRGQRPETADFRARGRSPSELAMAAEDSRLVRETLGQLPADYRQVLRLVFEEQLSLREAGERMARTREAAKKLYGRALTRFTRALKRRRGQSHA